jgi:inner membrane protein
LESRAASADEAAIDPVCHTLVGAALGRAGLARRTGYGTTTLLLGANLPDIDVLAYLDGPAGDLAFRRGWTHGIPAMLVLPFILTGLIILIDMLVRRASRATLPTSVSLGNVLLLAAVSVWTHPMLDMLNTYGVRWLMPLGERWYYGDTLFIVDPWLWAVLAIGVVLSKERRHHRFTGRPARVALGVATGYVALMALGGEASRRIAASELAASAGALPERLMVGPIAVTPMTRYIVAAQGDRYVTGYFRWLRRPHIDPATVKSYPRARPATAAVGIATHTVLGRRFLSWARFPVVQEEPAPGGGSLVHLIDLRYADRPGAGFGTVTIPVSSR